MRHIRFFFCDDLQGGGFASLDHFNTPFHSSPEQFWLTDLFIVTFHRFSDLRKVDPGVFRTIKTICSRKIFRAINSHGGIV